MRVARSFAAVVGLVGLVNFVAEKQANAGCGFYAPPATASGAALINDADQVSFFRDGNRVALTMSTNYKGPLDDFAMIVPVPVVLRKEAVLTLPPTVFEHLEKLTAPRVVEREERDPCHVNTKGGVAATGGAAPPGAAGGFGGRGEGLGVKVEASFVVGEYEIVVLSAKDSDGLEKWLIENKYKIPEGASVALAPYVTAQQKFVVAKVDKTKVKRNPAGVAVLSPLRFVYETNDFRLPVRLGLLNAPPGGKQDLIVYLLTAGKRLEAANYPNVFVPTNVDVASSVSANLGSFYATLFDATMAKAGGRAVVTEYVYPANLCGEPCVAGAMTSQELLQLGADMPGILDSTPDAYTLTRVHTRYDASTLTEDIVFRSAEPVAGGRDVDPGAEGDFAVKGTSNAFQARYVVRHPWVGAIDCKDPVRGVWLDRRGSAPPALSLADVSREASLASLVVSPIAPLAIVGTTKKFGGVAGEISALDKGDKADKAGKANKADKDKSVEAAKKAEADLPKPDAESTSLPWILIAGGSLLFGVAMIGARKPQRPK